VIAPEAFNAPACRTAGFAYGRPQMMRTMLCSFAGRAMTIRVRRYRLFCRLDYDAKDRPKPLLVVIRGLDKPSAKQAPGLHEFQGLSPSSRAEILCHTRQAERSVNPFELMV
jgi:hypothetical protein